MILLGADLDVHKMLAGLGQICSRLVIASRCLIWQSEQSSALVEDGFFAQAWTSYASYLHQAGWF